MTMAELDEKIKKKVTEEDEDYKDYMELAEFADQIGMPDIGKVLKDIAHEEMTHKHHLMDAEEEMK